MLNVFKKVFLLLAIFLFLILSFKISYKIFENNSEQKVNNPPLANLPVLLKLKDDYSLETIESIIEVKGLYPNYSFLIDIKDLKNLNQRFIEQNQKGSIPQTYVEEVSADKQLITIRYSGDGLLEHKYEATEKEFKSLTYKLQGPGFVFKPCFTTIILGFVILSLIGITKWFSKRKTFS